MTTTTDRIIASLSEHHEQLASFAAGLTDEQLTQQSGASDWTVADVLSHLGSGAEINTHSFAAALAGEPAPQVDNQAIWDRWNAASPHDQAKGFIEHNGRLVELAQGATAEQRDTVRVDLGFLPEPVPLSTAAGMRLNEAALHGWDARVGVDAGATVSAEAA